MALKGPIETVQAMTRFLDGMGARIPEIAKRAAGPIQGLARASYARGESPNGEIWARRKRDGALAYQRPTKGVTFRGLGYAIVGEGEDVLKWPQTSTRYPREIFPKTKLPESWEKAIEAAGQETLGDAPGVE